jgi:hypothetical protein
MDLAAQLKRIRRFLRDPDGNIWDDDTLINLYNDVQEDLQNQTHILKDLKAIRVPQLYQFTYMHDWEWSYLPTDQTQFYQCFYQNQQSDLVATTDWEQQQLWGLSITISDIGAHFAHPWEGMLTTPGDEMELRFPKDFRSAQHISWNREPLEYKSKSEIMRCDPSYKTYTGRPVAYYRKDELSNGFCLYPRPTAANWLDGSTEGTALFGSDLTVDTESGTITRGEDLTLSQSTGSSIDVIDATNNVILFYEQNTTDLESVTDESQWPEYLRKYIEYGVISRAYGANTDGRIQSLSDYWRRRYDLGVVAIKKFMNIRMADRTYRLTTKDSSRYMSKRKHVRLPSTYKDVNP